MTAILLNDGEIAAGCPEKGRGFLEGRAALKIKGQAAKNKFACAWKIQDLHTGHCAKILIMRGFFAFAKIF